MAQSVRGVSEILREIWLHQASLNAATVLFREWKTAPRPDLVLVGRFWGAV